MSERRIELSVSPDRTKPPRRRPPTNEWAIEEPTQPDPITRMDDLPPQRQGSM